MNEDKKSYRRLNKTMRDEIERYLNLGKSLSWIAGELHVFVSTISREVKTHRTDLGSRNRSVTGNVTNLCASYKTCKKTDVCTVCESAYHPRCATCKKVRCSNLCKDYVKLYCKSVEKAPYCCNSCVKTKGCYLRKWRYLAREAQMRADDKKVVSRSGIDLDPAVLGAVNELVRPLLRQGQTPGQIWLTHADDIPFSRRTFYRYNELGLFGMTALELTRKASYKKRRGRPKESGSHVAEGHAYKDFLALGEDVRLSVVEMDTVMGTKHDVGSILTLHIKRLLFQIGIKLIVHGSEHAVSAIDQLEELLGVSFGRFYGIGLCDRGIEFFPTEAFETSKLVPETKRMQLFYCDARRANQKGSAERNHVEFRKVVPKGTSIDSLTNYELAEIFSHVNSAPRRTLFGMSPMALAMQVLPKEFFDELGLRLIAPDDIILNPTLIK